MFAALILLGCMVGIFYLLLKPPRWRADPERKRRSVRRIRPLLGLASLGAVMAHVRHIAELVIVGALVVAGVVATSLVVLHRIFRRHRNAVQRYSEKEMKK
jgi:hypothetical protein